LFHFVKDENDYTFNSEHIRVPSARALVYADKRANPAGRLPDDTWVLRPQDLPEGFLPADDTWYYARVAGTFAERQGFHGCQMPEQLLGRIIRVSSNPNDVVLDPFAGSGTTLAVAKKLSRRWIGCELSDVYVQSATERLNAIKVGGSLDGPADPVASAPSTANGRKLSIAGFAAMQESATHPKVGDKQSAAPQDNAPAQASKSLELPTAAKLAKRELREVINAAIINAFHSSSDGHSIDWLLSNAQLQASFHHECRESGLIGSHFDWNKTLLRLRKSGHFPKEGGIKRVHFSESEMDEFRFAAEIAWRSTREKFKNVSLDDILCDPVMADYFDRTAKRYSVNFNSAGCRWAALGLRKASKKLVDHVKQYQFIFQTRKFPSRGIDWHRLKVDRYSGQPGMYMLRDEGKQPLFVDNTIDLGARLSWHAGCKGLLSVVRDVIVLPPDDLPGEMYENSFKVDLVRRYDPTLNVNLCGLGESLAI
ncbi:MAG TPA: site-specific DNA-methyltransferase, partial [Lacipirellulaceae bacterium]|nr:site-specific DNA-methyltransferase [Lacipirellulaceae bacterium]